jgi:hypothetical protein
MGFSSRLGASVMSAALLAPAVAWGDAGAADRDNARTYMSDGRAKRDAGDLRGALRAFQAADALMHVPTTAFEVAKTEGALGMLIEAREDALKIARSQAKPGEPAPFAEARTSAQKLADDVEPRIPSIRLVLKNADAATVSIDDVALPSVAIGLPRRLDPGAHLVVAKLGSVERRITVQVLEREAKEIPIDLTDATQTTPTTTTTANTTTTLTVPQTTATTTTEMPQTAASKGPWMAVGVTTLVVGGIGLVVGGITGALSLSQTGTIKSQCPNSMCPTMLSDGSNTQTALGNARTMATVSDVGFIAGGVVAALGAVFVIVAATKKSHPMALRVGPGSFELGGQF